LQAGDLDLLLRGKIGLSDVVVMLLDVNEGNLTRHPAFPIFISNLVEASGSVSLPRQMSTGEAIELPPADKYPVIKITSPDGSDHEFSAERSDLFSQTLEPGLYAVGIIDLDGVEEDYQIGLNAGHRDEADLTPGVWTSEQIAAAGLIELAPAETLDLTPYLLGIAILFLGLEAWRAWR
jgi:hypothetical protein